MKKWCIFKLFIIVVSANQLTLKGAENPWRTPYGSSNSSTDSTSVNDEETFFGTFRNVPGQDRRMLTLDKKNTHTVTPLTPTTPPALPPRTYSTTPPLPERRKTEVPHSLSHSPDTPPALPSRRPTITLPPSPEDPLPPVPPRKLVLEKTESPYIYPTKHTTYLEKSISESPHLYDTVESCAGSTKNEESKRTVSSQSTHPHKK